MGDLTRAGTHADVVGAEIVGADGEAMTPDLVLPQATTRVEVRLLDSDGRPIPGMEKEHAVALHWRDAGLIRTDSVPGQPFQRDLTVVSSCFTTELRIGYGHKPHTDERVFGPFPVHSKQQITSAKIFGVASGAELTPHLVLPSRQTTVIEVRFYDCMGQRITDPGEEKRVQLLWNPVNFAAVGPVEGKQFQLEVYPLVPPGTRAQMSIGFGTGDYPHDKVFGPFDVTVE